MAQEEKNTADSALENITVHLEKEQNKITIDDVAGALGVSKTTVSRAISGKGRISESTRQRVMEYIKRYHYRPNVVAKGLANSKTYNIGWIIPGDSGLTDLPFFQRCILGVNEVAMAEDYDILISMVFEHDISQVKRIVKNHKVDGVIVGRTLVEDRCVSYLKESGMPFVVIGSSMVDDVIQIDNDHISACKELTSILKIKGIRNFALIGGDANHMVNQTRRLGFEMGLKEQGVAAKQNMVYMDCESEQAVGHVVEECIRRNVECIMCTDDKICQYVLNKLTQDGIDIPGQVKVASFYNSVILDNYHPSITSLQYDPRELGTVACKTLFDYISGKEVQRKKLLGYEMVLKGSTQ